MISRTLSDVGASATILSDAARCRLQVGENDYKKFKILAGGNPDCPINCTRPSCKKGSKCAFSHKNMA